MLSKGSDVAVAMSLCGELAPRFHDRAISDFHFRSRSPGHPILCYWGHQEIGNKKRKSGGGQGDAKSAMKVEPQMMGAEIRWEKINNTV
jgi:hypothetical protein